MSFYTIQTSNTSFLSNSESVIYAGKNGFTTVMGSIPILCDSYSSNASSIVLNVRSLNLLTDDNYGVHVLAAPSIAGESNTFIKIPITQYAESDSVEGSSGYYSSASNSSLEIRSFNVSSNTITLYNKNTSSGQISDLIVTAPFYITVSQTLRSNNVNTNSLYVSGSYKTFTQVATVSGLSSYTFSLRKAPRFRSSIRVFVDDVVTNDYVWTISSPLTLTVSSLVNATQVSVLVDDYTVPAIEANDLVSLSIFNNTYYVVNTSYQTGSNSFNSNLTSNAIYKITLDKSIPDNILSYYLINISDDLEGSVSNITSNSFTVDYENSYPYNYSLANTGVYYLFQKNRVRYTSAKVDDYGKLLGLSPQNYIVEATTINRYNRISSTVRGLLQIEGIKLSKVSSLDVVERIFIDTTGGASISASVEFTPLVGRDVTSYELLYRIVSTTSTTLPEHTRVVINNDESVDTIRHTINNLTRGPVAGSNTLQLLVTPMNGSLRGFTAVASHPLIGKLTSPAGLSDFNASQQGDSITYTWQFAQTNDGYILDLDTKEVEIREYPGTINLADEESVAATWTISLVVDRIPFPNTTFTTPISKYGDYTYFIRVRDTSNNESDKINAAIISLGRSTSRIYKAYNEGDPSSSFVTQDGIAFPNSNAYPETGFPSFSDSLYDGFVYYNSTNVDNANGSSSGFSVDAANPSALSTTNQSFAEYVTQIRDVGSIIRGAIRIKPIISISSSITYNDQYRLVQSGVSDYHNSDNLTVNTSILVDNAFGGIGNILGYSNANTVSLSYNVYAETLTSGGPSGNVYAIRNPGQFANDAANANMFAFIAGVISNNSVRLGEVFYANGKSTGSNAFPNISIAGNAYELVDLAQFTDTAGGLTYLGPTRDITQNIYVRYATSNVFYTAAANGVPGFPGHGNTNPNSFVGASDNASLGFKRYVSGDLDFRFVQIQLQYSNREPTSSSLVLEDFTYEIDVQEKTFTTIKQITSVNGSYVDYSFRSYIESPKVTASLFGANGAYVVNISNVSSIGCNVTVYQANTGLAVTNYNVSVTAIGI
jgi:hypothetical protein